MYSDILSSIYSDILTDNPGILFAILSGILGGMRLGACPAAFRARRMAGAQAEEGGAPLLKSRDLHLAGGESFLEKPTLH